MNDSLQHLAGHGLPITWPVVIYGWRHGHLTTDDVLAQAMDQIGYAAPNQADLVAELAFVDPTDWWTIDRIANELVTLDTGAQFQSARVWRWILLSDLVCEFSHQIDSFEAAGGSNGFWLDELTMDVWDFNEFWETQKLYIEIPTNISEWFNAPNRADGINSTEEITALRYFVDMHYKWLDEEKTNLWAEAGNKHHTQATLPSSAAAST